MTEENGLFRKINQIIEADLGGNSRREGERRAIVFFNLRFEKLPSGSARASFGLFRWVGKNRVCRSKCRIPLHRKFSHASLTFGGCVDDEPHAKCRSSELVFADRFGIITGFP